MTAGVVSKVARSVCVGAIAIAGVTGCSSGSTSAEKTVAIGPDGQGGPGGPAVSASAKPSVVSTTSTGTVGAGGLSCSDVRQGLLAADVPFTAITDDTAAVQAAGKAKLPYAVVRECRVTVPGMPVPLIVGVDLASSTARAQLILNTLAKEFPGSTRLPADQGYGDVAWLRQQDVLKGYALQASKGPWLLSLGELNQAAQLKDLDKALIARL